jgi:hypothetical protein
MKILNSVLIFFSFFVANLHAMEQRLECALGAQIKLTDETKQLSHESDLASFNQLAAASPVIQQLIAQNPTSINLNMITKSQFLILENIANLLANPDALTNRLEAHYALPDALLRIIQAGIDLQIEPLKKSGVYVLSLQLGGQKEISISKQMLEKGEILQPLLEFMQRFSTVKHSQEIKLMLKPLLLKQYERVLSSIAPFIFSIFDVRALALLNNNQERLIASSGDGSLVAWDFKNGSKLKEIREKGILYDALAIGDNQKLLVGASATHLYLFNADTLQNSYEKETQAIINAVAVHPKSSICIAAQYGGVTLFDLTANKQVDILTNASAIFYGAAFSSSGKFFAIVGNDRKLHIFNVNDRKKEEFNLTEPAFAVAFNPKNDDEVIVGDRTGFSIINTGKKTRAIAENMKESTKAVAFSQDGKRFAAASEKKIVLGSINNTIEIKNRFEIAGTKALVFSPDNRLLIIGTKNGIRIIDYSVYVNNYVDVENIIYLAALDQAVRSAKGIEKPIIELPEQIKNQMRTQLPSFVSRFIDNPTLFAPALSKAELKEEVLEKEIAEFEKVPSVKTPTKQPETWTEYLKGKLGKK